MFDKNEETKTKKKIKENKSVITFERKSAFQNKKKRKEKSKQTLSFQL